LFLLDDFLLSLVFLKGIYNDNQSLMLSPGYANNPQMMYGAYSPVSTVRDGQQYLPMHFPFSNSYYQPPASPSMGYSNSVPGISQGDPMLQPEYFLPDGLLYSPTPGYHQPFSSFDRGNISPLQFLFYYRETLDDPKQCIIDRSEPCQTKF